jgi:hypothetical protein
MESREDWQSPVLLSMMTLTREMYGTYLRTAASGCRRRMAGATTSRASTPT